MDEVPDITERSEGLVWRNWTKFFKSPIAYNFFLWNCCDEEERMADLGMTIREKAAMKMERKKKRYRRIEECIKSKRAS